MDKQDEKHFNYLGSFIGFWGALFLAIAMSETKAGGTGDIECIASGKIDGCIKYYVVMDYPLLNRIGLILLVAGFFIQFIPAIPHIQKWICKKLKHLRMLKFNK